MASSISSLPPRLEVVVCTYNPNLEYLQRTVDGLRKQTLSQELWAFMIVDNASPTPVAASFSDWHRQGRIVKEPEPGLTQARVCGIKNTQSELILFVDDDNVLDPDYLENVLQLADQHPELGAYGAGQILPEFAVEPDADCRRFTKGLALRNYKVAIWSNDPEDRSNPWGAGLVVRREVAEEFVRIVTDEPIRKTLGRTGNKLNSAEDIEFAWIACSSGMAKGIFPQLKIQHLIDAGRVDRGYLARLCEGHAFSHSLVKYIHHADIVQRADRLNGLPNGGEWRTPTPSIFEQIKYLYAWMLAKLPVCRRRFPNQARLAGYNGIRRCRRLIRDIESGRKKTQDRQA